VGNVSLVKLLKEDAVKQSRAAPVAALALVVAGLGLAAVVVASCGSTAGGGGATAGQATPAPTQATGLTGTITLVNPGGPMIAAGQSPAPAPAVVVELLSPSTRQVLARGLVGRDGAFRIAAPPGRYLVRVAPVAGGPSMTISRPVVVAPGGYAHLVLGPLRGL
jgi:hypothetical protein